ncbi:MAG: alpha/beta hydrolase [Nitrososphaera sp.]|nr:alpha/beta hydrolase [Nitrososphaera sp.]
MLQRTTTVNGHSIRYLDYRLPFDNAKDLVLLHGIGASADRWLRAAPILSRYFRVVVPDIIGFGYSDKPTVEYTMEFFCDFLKDLLENLNISRPNMIASSFGGHLASEFAIRYGDIERLVLVSPSGMMRTSSPTLDGYIMAALYPTFDNALKAFREMANDPDAVTDDIIMDFVNRMRLPNAKYAFMSTLLGIRYSPPLTGRLSSVSVPTLIVWGEADKMIPVQYAKHFTEIPNSELKIIPDCGHTPYVEEPEKFSKIALDFLNGKSRD